MLGGLIIATLLLAAGPVEVPAELSGQTCAAGVCSEMPKKKGGGGGKRQRQSGGGQVAGIPQGSSSSPPSVSPKELGPPVVVASTEDAALSGSEQLMTVEGAMTPPEATEWISFAESLGLASTRPKGGIPERGHAYRDNFRAQIHDRDIAGALWASGLGRSIGSATPPLADGRKAVGFNDNIRLYRYDPGLRFGKHYDTSDKDSLGRQTLYTVLIYLSECGGGETVFYEEHGGGETARVTPTVGMALLHRHGVDCWQHEALAVTSGVKYILRTDVVYAFR
jgi:hypothetical protein